MSLERLGEAMGRDPEQLSDWLSGRHKPFRKSLEKIEQFLAIAIQELTVCRR